MDRLAPSDDVLTRSAIAQNIANFVFREGGADAVRELFHPHATISVSWYSGGIDGFIDTCRPLVLAKHSYGLP
ncbi:MAG TPA: hypothetical protein VFJ70_12520, partial [Burkholderiales bacterium]|nr:hypothetical protein [Burkholderiales bacterium]